MRKKLWLLLLLLSGLLLPVSGTWSAGGPERGKIERVVAATVEVERGSEKQRQAWLAEKSRLTDETHALELEARLLRARVEKLESYRLQRQKEIARFEAGLAEMRRIDLELEPELDALVGRLERFIATDLPFDRQERQQRLVGLRRELDRYDSRLAEKLRRVFEALKIEAGYGRGFEVGEENLKLDGTETTVQVLRLGRIGLYYLTLDGRQAGWYDRRKRAWEPLAVAYRPAIREALRMALKQRAFDLVRLPVVGAGAETAAGKGGEK